MEETAFFLGGALVGLFIARMMYHKMYHSAMECLREVNMHLRNTNEVMERVLDEQFESSSAEADTGVVFRSGEI